MQTQRLTKSDRFLIKLEKNIVGMYFFFLIVIGLNFPTQAEEKNPKQVKLPSGFVRLADIESSIVQEMRYAGPNNFTGGRVPGYEDRVCILAYPLALALKRAQAKLKKQGLGLKVYDCYRPVRAVKSFIKWAENKGADKTKFYYPRISRAQIIPFGYVARRSSHSLGISVDLTLVRRDKHALKSRYNNVNDIPLHEKSNVLCHAFGLAGPNDRSIDMGTAWDCFDINSHTYSSNISEEAQLNRRLLLHVLQSEGLRNYSKEWWHFSIESSSFKKMHNFAVK